MQSELRKENLWGPVVLDSVVVTCINYLFFLQIWSLKLLNEMVLNFLIVKVK